MHRNRLKILMLAFFVLGTAVLFSVSCLAADALKVKIGGGKAKVTYIKGDVFLVKEDKSVIKKIKKDDMLPAGSRISTRKGARIELGLPDGSFVRFDENTNFILSEIKYNVKTKKRSMRIRMALGKTWAKVSRKRGRGRFALATKTAVAGVRGTTYRMNVKEDDSVTIKVYWGEILVESMKKKDKAGKKDFKKPRPVLGPTPVAGPRPVSMEEWVYIVGALQQINIRPDGTAEKPFRFDIMADLNEWVQWNKERDKAAGDL